MLRAIFLLSARKDPAFEFSCKLADALELVGDVLSDLFKKVFFGLVAFEHQHVPVLIVSLETGVIPVLDEVVGQVKHCLSLQMHTHIMPGQSRCVPRDPVPPKFPHVLEVRVSGIVVLYSGVVVRIVVVDEVKIVIETTISQVQTPQKGFGLIDDDQLLMVTPESGQNSKGMLDNFDVG